MSVDELKAKGNALFSAGNYDEAIGWFTKAIDAGGKTLGSSEAITGDQPQAEIVWEEGRWHDWKGSAVSLRFVMQNAKLYSYWIST